MKKFCIHIGIGVGLFILFYFSPKFLITALDWLDKNEIIGASWLNFATWELAIGTVAIGTLWIICLIGLPFQWHRRFHSATKCYVCGVLGLFPGLAVVALPGFVSRWCYQHGIWPIGFLFRLINRGQSPIY